MGEESVERAKAARSRSTLTTKVNVRWSGSDQQTYQISHCGHPYFHYARIRADDIALDLGFVANLPSRPRYRSLWVFPLSGV